MALVDLDEAASQVGSKFIYFTSESMKLEFWKGRPNLCILLGSIAITRHAMPNAQSVGIVDSFCAENVVYNDFQGRCHFAVPTLCI